ncbi:MAG: prepilin-type N-terminal cleavage/methylation domain-containing protein [Elusimicrobiaceae bacterium]|nr:prepilin-type N-terminal cleavage/methylation domain-containing protein [Elusimicrobiaceae bacterium]
MFRGFTLIELLVVVLIIGILAAVAVPQYQKAVTKSHLAKLKSIVNTLYQARQRYYLEHGNHATRIGDLDIEWGEPDAANPDLHRLDNITCSIYMCATVGQGVGYVIGYMINNSGKRTCVADSRKNTPSKNIPNQVCKAETGRNGNSSATNFDIYFMYTWDY